MGAQSMDFVVTNTDALALPLDELALTILRDVETNDEWNSHNWMLKAQQSDTYSWDALHAFAEAWQWLYAKGLVARSPSQNSADAIFVTRRGKAALVEGAEPMRAAERLDVDLHPLLERKVRRQFLMQEYELAAFAAMKTVEVRVRGLADAEESLIGVKLMRTAFADGGPLHEEDMDGGERVAHMELFAGAIGVFKNPSSHRTVSYDDPTEAAEVVLFADLLLRLLDKSRGATG